MAVREADFAGSWYPAKKREVKKMIKEFESEASDPKELEGSLNGGIVPHAGWVFSGKLACNVIKVLSEHSDPDTVIVTGTHMGPSQQPRILLRGEWWTPMGNIPVDEEMVEGLVEKISFGQETPEHFSPDNSIELQIPFIKHYFPDCKIVTLGVPANDKAYAIADTVVSRAQELGRRIVVIGSSDLTHYGPNYGMMPKGVGEEAVKWVKEVNDRRIIDVLVGMDEESVMEEALENHNACCMGSAAAAVRIAKKLGSERGELLDYYTSYDISPGTSFVGYAGIVF